MTETGIFRLERRFDAPRALVWQAWTDPKLLARWYGPMVDTIIHKLDPTPGGLWLTEMRMGEHGHFERIEFVEVVEPESMVWLQSMAGPDFTAMANPMMPDWPRVLRGEVTLSEEAPDKTLLAFTWQPHEASEAEIACFTQAMSGPAKGWNSGMDTIEEILAELQA